MADFSQEITNFKKYGTYNYVFDEVGNEIVNPSSSVFQEVYFSLPLSNYNYNDSKILSFYNPDFTEFVPTTPTSSLPIFPQEVIDQINAVTYQNIQLQNQLDNLIANSEFDTGSADVQVVKDVIVNLRIQLNQGTSASDFENVFPYSPIPVEMRNLPPSTT